MRRLLVGGPSESRYDDALTTEDPWGGRMRDRPRASHASSRRSAGLRTPAGPRFRTWPQI